MAEKTDAEVAAARKRIAWPGAALALIGIVGLLVATSWYVLWVALIAFGTATLPRDARKWLRKKRHSPSDPSA